MLLYLILIVPTLLLAMVAQWWVSSAYARMQKMGARMNGSQAARHILDANGLHQVDIEPVPGRLSDHYDPQSKVLRLSPEVYHGYTLASVGIAAHEAGHAIQDAKHYAPLVVRSLAIPISNFGSGLAGTFLMLGFGMMFLGLAKFGSFVLLLGILGFGATVAAQVINLPVEFNASTRARQALTQLGIISPNELPYVSEVLTAAALTYVAATLQSLMTLIYYLVIYFDATRGRD